MSNIYFTSDTHMYHKNILSFEDRPFDTVDEMNQGLIEIWNNTVKDNDIVYHLGDFVFHGEENWRIILPQLNGKIRLIRGNHDSTKIVKKLSREGFFDEYHDVGCYIKHNKQCMWLTHYPMEIGNRANKFSVSGHIHSTPSEMLNQINVGVDSPLNFNRPFGQPIHLDELLTYMDHMNPIIREKFEIERGLK